LPPTTQPYPLSLHDALPISDYVIDYLRRPLLAFFTMREGRDITTPIEAIFGPKVMIINEMAGSGGDAMPWLFRHAGIGPLVGARDRKSTRLNSSHQIISYAV